MTEEDIRAQLAAHANVHVQVAAPGDGSPQMAWGDSFFSLVDAHGKPRQMPFATIVTKDYGEFDRQSRLDRGGLFRLNIDVGKALFEQLFGFAAIDFERRRNAFDFAALDLIFPHPVYAASGWLSIINPSDRSQPVVASLLDLALERASAR